MYFFRKICILCFNDVPNSRISFRLIKSNVLPQNLQNFFLISSTIIRKAIQAGHDLKSFLPYNAGELILKKKLYSEKTFTNNENAFKFNELNLSCIELIDKLEYSAKLLLEILNELKNKNKPHKFSVLETSTGGRISECFTSLIGASNHFVDGRILYSKESQKKFLDKSLYPKSSVTKKMAKDLAINMRKISKSDWALAETGMLGPPSIKKRSIKSGHCYLGLASRKEVKYKFIKLNPFQTRKEHQLLISIEAINWIKNIIQK